MNEKPDPRSRLLAETFSDDWDDGPGREFARRAAAQVRRRRRLLRVLPPAALAVAMMAALFSAQRGAPRTFVRPENVAAPARDGLIAPASKISPAFEIISDDELFAELRTRPLLILPDRPAEQRYVVLAP